MINKEDEIIKSIYNLERLINKLQEYRKNNVKTVCIEIYENEAKETIIAPDIKDLKVIKPDTSFL